MAKTLPHTVAAAHHTSKLLRELKLGSVYPRSFFHDEAAGAALTALNATVLSTDERASVEAAVNRVLREATADGRLTYANREFTIARRSRITTLPTSSTSPSPSNSLPSHLPAEMLSFFSSEQLLAELSRRLSLTSKDS